ncbi:hypothetical protein HDV00_012388 [Rhizophlyctis rosea]|nr:hypothetical protein HDV00_012388 [Rhizophlyctis rosea]
MEPHKFHIIPMPPDGDCFYHCLSRGLAETKKQDVSPFDLRREFAALVMNDSDVLDETLSEWRDHGIIGKNETLTAADVARRILFKREWATSSTIHRLAITHRVFIHVYSRHNGKLLQQRFPEECEISKPCRFKHHVYVLFCGNHFDYLLPYDVVQKVTAPKIKFSK